MGVVLQAFTAYGPATLAGAVNGACSLHPLGVRRVPHCEYPEYPNCEYSEYPTVSTQKYPHCEYAECPTAGAPAKPPTDSRGGGRHERTAARRHRGAHGGCVLFCVSFHLAGRECVCAVHTH